MKIYHGGKLIAEGRAGASFSHRKPKKLEHVTIAFWLVHPTVVEPEEARYTRIEIPLYEFKTMMTKVIQSMR
jgi:hypothetical protein